MLFYLNKVLALGLTFILKYVSCRSRYKRQHFPQRWFMGRVNFNGIVISLQSIVVHGAGGLKKSQGVSINRSSASLPVFWSLQRVLGECFLLFFFSYLFTKMFLLGCFHLLFHSLKWASYLSFSPGCILGETSHALCSPCRRRWWCLFWMSRTQQGQQNHGPWVGLVHLFVLINPKEEAELAPCKDLFFFCVFWTAEANRTLHEFSTTKGKEANLLICKSHRITSPLSQT